MTTDRNTLLKLIKEYSDSLLRIESEKDLQKAIAEQAEEECQVKPAQFKKAAMAYFKDKVKALRDELGEQVSNASKTASDSILGILSQTLILPLPTGRAQRDFGLKQGDWDN